MIGLPAVGRAHDSYDERMRGWHTARGFVSLFAVLSDPEAIR